MLKYWLWLTERPGLTNQVRLALLRHFGTPEAVYYADPEELLLTEGITAAQVQHLSERNLEDAENILEACDRLHQHILTIQDAAYPDRLKNIYDPPCLLYWQGHLPAFDEEAAIAVVGTRSNTPYGVACAEKLGYGLAAGGALVVSGLARAIDSAALRGALRAGKPAVGVTGGGLDVFYPRENQYLYEDIAAAGVLISEYPPGTEPKGAHFPVRNRIISGLCVGTLVVEAPERSGALITAETALEQGRDVFAVPGPIDAPCSAGCNRLIREGAGLTADAWDILQEYAGSFPAKLCQTPKREEPAALGYQARQQQTKPARKAPPSLDLNQTDLKLTDDQIMLLEMLGEEEPLLVDDLVDRTQLPTRRVLSALTVLEMEHLVTQHSGKRYTRAVTLYK